MPSSKGNSKNKTVNDTSANSNGQSISSGIKINGNNADNVIAGDINDEFIDAKAGNDQVDGGEGNDRVKGGSGNDVVEGGAGNDDVEAGSGNDQAIYSVTDNAFAADTYDGGSGIDSLTLDMNRNEWMRNDVQGDIASYLEFLNAHIDPETGEADGERFNYTAFDLEARKFESLRPVVDGVELDPVDEVVTTNDDSATTSGEHSPVSGNVLANDLVPDLVRSVELLTAPVLGSFTFDDDGSWSYDPGNDFDALAEGETAQVSFTYRVTDADHDEGIAKLLITVTGTNDAPVAVVDEDTTDENTSITVDVLANDTDVDDSDTHTVNLASITAGLGVVSIVDNQVQWSPGSDYDYLAVGEEATVEIAYTMSDNNDAESESTLTLIVTGTNDLPVVTSLEETTNEDADALAIDLLSSASDVDSSDVLSLNSLVQTDGRIADFNLLDSTLSIDPGQFNDLAAGDSETLIFAYNVNDGHEDVANEAVVVIEGRNDAPVVASALVSNTNEEDESYTIDLLEGASDVDAGAILSAASILEADGKGGWSVDGNTLTVNPDYFDDLNNGEFETLNLSYQVEDEHGEAVDQTLTVNVEGFTDAPSLAVHTSAGEAVNEVRLHITSAPANNERVVLSFSGLVPGAVVLDSANNNVSNGIADFSGTSIFTLLLPEGVDIKSALAVTVSGVNDDGSVIGQTVQDIDVSVDVATSNALLSFTSEDQNMWGSGDNISIGWHEYFPFVGTETEAWSSGDVSLIDIHLDSDVIAQDALEGLVEVRDLALVAQQQASDALAQTRLDEARANAKANHVEGVVAAWIDYDAKNLIYLTAKGAHEAAQALADGAGDAAADLEADLAAANAVLNTLKSESTALYNASKFTYEVWVPTPKWTDPFDGYWSTRTGTDPIKYTVYLAKEAEVLAQKLVVGGIQTLIDLAEVGEDGLQAAADELLPARLQAEAIKLAAFNYAKDLEDAMHDDGFFVGEAVNALDVTAAWADHASLLLEIPLREGILLLADEGVALAQGAVDAAQLAIDEIDFNADLDLSVELHAKVGLQVDFELDLGSVDTAVDYQLTTQTQYNLTTDMLQLTPMMANQTTGESVAFSTISPNATFKAAILYDVGANLDVFVDAATVLSGTTIFDISGDATGITLNESIDMAGELVLIDFDSTEAGPIKVPGIADMTADVVTLEVSIPTIETEGKAADFDMSYFEEGGFINVDFSEISSAFFNFINAGIDFSPEIKEAFGGLSLEPGSDDLEAITAAVGDVLEGIWSVLNGDADTDGDGVIPIFLLDATDETASSLFHLNIIPDDISTIDVDTASFGFYVAYGESDPIVKVSIDLDQFIALVANRVLGNPTNAIINPLVKEYGLDLLLDIATVPEATATEIKKYVNLNFKFEYADVDVYSAWKFKQEFTLSVDDMAYVVTMEDDTTYLFNANDEGDLLIENASQHDANHDGIIDYDIDIVPKAMFSNDTEVGLSIGYTLDFLKAQLDAGIKLPLAEILDIPSLPVVPIPLVDLGLGPLLRVKGDLDILDVDLFEDRFEMDIGADSSSGLISAIDDELSGTASDDELSGFEGNDLLNGGAGDDVLSGGDGNDLFVFAANDGNDTITDFVPGEDSDDVLDLQLLATINSFDDVLAAADTDGAGNTEIDLGDGNSITLIGVDISDLHQDDVYV